MNFSRGLGGRARGPALVRHDAPSDRSDYRHFPWSKRFVWSVATIAAEALLRRQSNGGFRECGLSEQLDAEQRRRDGNGHPVHVARSNRSGPRPR